MAHASSALVSHSGEIMRVFSVCGPKQYGGNECLAQPMCKTERLRTRTVWGALSCPGISPPASKIVPERTLPDPGSLVQEAAAR